MNKIKYFVIVWMLIGSTNLEAKQTRSTQDSVIIKLRQKLNLLSLSGLTITDIQFVAQGTYTPVATGKELVGLPAFCRIAATLRPTDRSEIKIEIWMPQIGWNGRLLGTGNGGGGGSILYASLAGGIKKGYVTVNTDMGTSRGGANGAVDNPEVWADFGYRATHFMTVASKAILKTFYGKVQHHAYFVGCSTGGQQALMEAQRFPEDYDGIIAGAPANNRTHLHTGFLLNYKLTNMGKNALFSKAELEFISSKITSAYALKSGGAPGDNFLTDPRLLKVNFNLLFKCREGSKDTCLTDEQIKALKEIYAGPVNPITGERIYASPPVGSESVSGGLVYQQEARNASSLFYQFKWVFGKDFDYKKFDFDRDQSKVDSILAPMLNANNPDLKSYQKNGGKIIMYTGTADPLVPFQDALNYYERVVVQQGSLKQTQSFFRYFLIPGMGHCGGGPGLSGFKNDILTDLVSWVEHGTPPDKLVADAANCCVVNGPRMQRPVFPYPKFPKYVGGDVNAVSSYIGVSHKRNGVVKPAAKYLK